MNSDEAARLPSRITALLEKWPDAPRSALDWETQAASIMARLGTGHSRTSDLDVLAPPLPLAPGEGHVGESAQRNDVASLEAMELSRSNHAELRGSVGPKEQFLVANDSGPTERWRAVLWGSAIALAAGTALYFGVRGGTSAPTVEHSAAPPPAAELAAAEARTPPRLAKSTFTGSVMVGARACMSSDHGPVRATVTFASSGKVQSVSVEPSAGAGVDDCIRDALKGVEIAPFSEPTFSTSVNVDPQP